MAYLLDANVFIQAKNLHYGHRIALDQQLQDMIYQFEHRRGVVQKIDKRSRQLPEAFENADGRHKWTTTGSG